MTACAIAPEDKRAVAKNVGESLHALYGKRKSYAPALIKSAMRKRRYPATWDCWALCLFASQPDFDAYHAAIGEACNWSVMRSEMLAAIRPAPPTDMNTGNGSDFLGDLFNWVT